MNKSELIKNIYLYTFSAVGLILMIIGGVKLLDLGLKSYVFKNADIYYTPQIPHYNIKNTEMPKEQIEKEKEEQIKAQEINIKAERQRTASNSLAMIIVGLPLFLYHWKKIRSGSL